MDTLTAQKLVREKNKIQFTKEKKINNEHDFFLEEELKMMMLGISC
jgi:hypothetical protein